MSTGILSRRLPRRKKKRSSRLKSGCRRKPAQLEAAHRDRSAPGNGRASGEKEESRTALRLARPARPVAESRKPARRARVADPPAPHRAPEEEELRRKRAQLDTLEAELARKELRLANLRAEMLPFESRYVRKVGVRSARLDEIEAQIAEFHARCHPGDAALLEAAHCARERAKRSRAALRRHFSAAGFDPPAALKQLYRVVARCVHPDFGENPLDREVRERLMSHANHAYQRGDERRLRGILTEYQFRPEGVNGEGTPTELVRVIRRIALIHGRLEEIEQETGETRSSELYRFKARTEAAAKRGRDLLAEAAAAFNARIAGARLKLRNLAAEPAGRAARADSGPGAAFARGCAAE